MSDKNGWCLLTADADHDDDDDDAGKEWRSVYSWCPTSLWKVKEKVVATTIFSQMQNTHTI